MIFSVPSVPLSFNMDFLLPGAECPPRCPGCTHLHLSPDQSAERKTAWLKKRLSPWEDRFLPMTVPKSDQIPGYRQKTCLSAEWSTEGWRFGLISGLELIPVPECPIHSAKIRRAIKILGAVLPPGPQFPLKYYVQSGAQIVLVLKSNRLPDTSWFDPGIENALHQSGAEGLWLNLFPSVGKKIFAKPGWHLIWGSARSRSVDRFVHGPTAFQQVFPGLHDKALDLAEAFLDPRPGDRVIDLYSGIGRTLSRWTGRGAKTAGVELCGEAVECAKENVPDAEIFRGTCGHRLVQLDKWLAGNGGSGDWLLYANPPRTGLEPEVTAWIIARRPRKIAYLSCSAGTLRRDLEILCDAGFRVAGIAPFDFFPRTRHVETLVMIEDEKRKKSESNAASSL